MHASTHMFPTGHKGSCHGIFDGGTNTNSSPRSPDHSQTDDRFE